MSLNDFTPALLGQLAHYTPYDATEQTHLERVIELLTHVPNPYSRSTRVGHITGSAILVDEARQHIAQIWHQKLQRWLQPGGHCEPDHDATVADTALRELIEETTIPQERLNLAQDTPFDIDVHPIPARGTEPDHFHYDIRYLFATTRDALPPDSTRYRWLPITELAQNMDISQARYAKKLLAIP